MSDELNGLPFVVRIDFKYICKHCIPMLKKRNALKKNVEQLDEKLFTDYKALCAMRCLAIKTEAKSSHDFHLNTNPEYK